MSLVNTISRMSWLKKLVLAAGLAGWYTFTSPDTAQLQARKNYTLPAEISVVDTTLPYETRKKAISAAEAGGEIKYNLEKIVKTKDIDFSKDFTLETERYKVVKPEEWLPSKIIGHTFSIPSKLLFWDWDAGWGLDADKTRAAISMLENNKKISGLTVRINHNEAIHDCIRLFSDKKVEERN